MTANQYKTTRQTLGMTQKELAEATGVSIKTISWRERGVVKITKQAELAIKSLR